MKTRSLKLLSLVLVITGFFFAAGGLLVTLMGTDDIHDFKYFGAVFSVMGIGFFIIDKNLTEIGCELKRMEGKQDVVNDSSG